METDDRSKPLSIDEIVQQQKDKPPKPKGPQGYPIAVGDSGLSLRNKPRTYHRDDPDTPSGEVVGARINNTTRTR